MKKLQLVVGNKNFSSWSMRAWLAMKLAGAEFEEVRIWLDEDGDRTQRKRWSPAGRVPVLLVDGFPVWDSLAIAETLHELFPDRGLWPAERNARARARSVCAEMHSGFAALRAQMPMNCRARRAQRDRGPEAAADVARVAELWSTTRADFGRGGPYLFGAWSLADVFYAPVASRLVSYAVPVEGAAAQYRDALLDHEHVRAWLATAEGEAHELEPYASAL